MSSKFRVRKSLRDKRQRDLDQILRILNESTSIVLLSQGPIKALQNVELRQKLNSIGANLRMVKRSIARIASSQSPLSKAFAPIKSVSLGIAFSCESDPVTLVKTIRAFVKQDPTKLNFLGGLIQSTLLGPKEVESVAEMQTAEQLYAQIISLLSAPVSRLVGLLNFPAHLIISAAEQYSKTK